MALHLTRISALTQGKVASQTSEAKLTPACHATPNSFHERSQAPSFSQQAARLATGIAIAATMIAQPPLALADQAAAEQLFSNTCAGCHAGGTNIVRRDATLSLDDLTKYGINSVDELYKLIYSGRGAMPGYGEGCAPKGACTFARRLTDEQVTDLAEYVLVKANTGWQ